MEILRRQERDRQEDMQQRISRDDALVAEAKRANDIYQSRCNQL